MKAGRSEHTAGMEGGPVQVARLDQAEAARREVMSSLAGIEPNRRLWTRPDRVTTLVIDTLIDHLIVAHSQSPARVCPHAVPEAFERSPRPLVLDAVRGVLACAERCYPKRSRSWPDEAACLECGRPVGGVVAHDLFIAYGPVLVAAALCPPCRNRRPAWGAPPGCATEPLSPVTDRDADRSSAPDGSRGRRSQVRSGSDEAG